MDESEEGRPAGGGHRGKRDAILTAARMLFLREGFDRTTMEAVATLAMVSKATVYTHFMSKELLCRAALEAEAHAARDEWRTLLHTRGSLQQRLTAVAQRVLRVWSRHCLGEAAYALLQPPTLPEHVHEQLLLLRFERYDTVMRVLLAREVARGRLSIDDAPEASAHFFGLVTGLPLVSAPGGRRDGLVHQRAVAARAVALFLSIYGQAAGPGAAPQAGTAAVAGSRRRTRT
ncbi:TetR/AcrR family transcriptional regulator [Xanthomonas maliensis]|uniref:TetR/AcrR family transcriptional regulator n=1 Tax=Xanthomonas maliensis TaxID=1321368 RepID=UPI0003AB3F1C|nr:TetR/AcrR family transcriptional regulator [Xanthomonas maliensis]KAB7770134.1 TetR/AcrR family transcriptional regulator [Xanthomonas maliensis]